MKYTQERVKNQLVNNCLNLTRLYGLDSNPTLIIREEIVVYGLVDINKVFWSKHPHTHTSQIATYHKSITIAFLSDLSNEIASIVK